MTQQTALVSFTTPADTGGSPILTYTVTANPGGIVAIGNISPILVTGLSSGVSYTFTVTATNAAGTSLPSASSPIVGVEIDPYYVNVSTLLHNHVIADVQGLSTTLSSLQQQISSAGGGGGATGGGTDKVFYENDSVVTTNYSITAGKNAMSAGPVTINNGVSITIPTNSSWSVV